MPSHRVHLYVDRVNFGRTYPRIHKAMDNPVKYYGKGHRIFFHDLNWAIYIAHREYPGDPTAVKSATLHLEFDRICSEDPEYRKCLEQLAKNDIKYRKRLRRTFRAYKKRETKRRKREQKKLKATLHKLLPSKKPKRKRRKKSAFKFKL